MNDIFVWFGFKTNHEAHEAHETDRSLEISPNVRDNVRLLRRVAASLCGHESRGVALARLRRTFGAKKNPDRPTGATYPTESKESTDPKDSKDSIDPIDSIDSLDPTD